MIAKKLYRWAIDKINGRFVSGWCFNRLNKSKPITLTIAADTTVLGRLVNGGYRKDVKEQGLHPSGVCAFDFSFPSDFNPEDFNVLNIFFDSIKSPIISVPCQEIATLRPELSRPICFMHIPKTAGSSFNAYAKTCFAGDRFATHIERLDENERGKSVDRAHYLAGHLPYGEFVDLVGSLEFDYYTIIREPFSHLHSHLNYVKGVRPASAEETYYNFRHNDTIKALSARLNDIDFNTVSEIEIFVNNLKGYELDFFDNIQTRYFLDNRPEKVTADELARAKENLLHFCSIGLTEQYDRFRDRFCKDLGLGPEVQSLRSNKSIDYELFDVNDKQVREAMLPLVVHDLELYSFVAESYW